VTRELPVRWQVLGYEPVAGAGSVDRPRLARIVCIPRLFYRNFCTRATAEGDIPPDMAWFIEYCMPAGHGLVHRVLPAVDGEYHAASARHCGGVRWFLGGGRGLGGLSYKSHSNSKAFPKTLL